MASTAQTLIEIAMSVEPKGGFSGDFDLVDALEANPTALDRFKTILASANAPELDAIYALDKNLGFFVMQAADEMSLLPDDPRLFLSESDADALPDDKVLGALCSACIVNDIATVLRLAKRVDVNALDHNNETALSYAVGNNHAECVRVLLGHGANPNQAGRWGGTAMHTCANTVSSKEIFQMLEAAGGDVNVKNDYGETVLDLLRLHQRRDWSYGLTNSRECLG